ncbi:MAG: oligosaccharide flippase family protein [Bacteroidales bacterium]|nr:oligosaccharide flippase family protein [Bacteroidales bacterium]
MAESSNKEYRNIFNSTLLFSFVRVVQMLVGVVRNKLVAILLGPSGVGEVEIYFRTTELIKKGAGLGLSQSALRDISHSLASGDRLVYERVMTATRRILLLTSLLGLCLTIMLSPLLSLWTFGDNSRIVPYILLSLVTFFTIRTEVQTSVLKGVRAQRYLALSSVAGSFIGLFVSVPVYYFWGEKGIVPALIINAVLACAVTDFFTRKIDCRRVDMTWKEVLLLAWPMIKTGVMLMAVGVVNSLFVVALSALLRKSGGLEMVGCYQAGFTVVNSYIGVVATALIMDYFPRVSAVNDNDGSISKELNGQLKIGILFIAPLLVLLMLCSRFVVDVLYTKDFSDVVGFLDLALFAAVFDVMSQCFWIILVAKKKTGAYLLATIVEKAVVLPVYIVLSGHFGMHGLGAAFLLDYILQASMYGVLVGKYSEVSLERSSFYLVLLTCAVTFFAWGIRLIPLSWLRYCSGAMLVLITVFFVNSQFKLYMNRGIFGIIGEYIGRGRNNK